MRGKKLEKLGWHSIYLSILLHSFIFLLQSSYFQDRYLTQNHESSQKNTEHKVLIELTSEDEEVSTMSPFVSSVSKKHQGKLKDTERGFNVVSFNTPRITQQFLKKTEKTEKTEKKNLSDRSFIKENQSSNQSERKEIKQDESRSIISENSHQLKLNINNVGEFSLGASSDIRASFYLKLVEAMRSSFYQFVRNSRVMGSDEAIFRIQVSNNGYIEFLDFVKQAEKQSSINYISQKMVEYSQKIDYISSKEVDIFGRGDIILTIRLSFNGDSYMWWLFFEDE